jgi:hypothetical protein
MSNLADMSNIRDAKSLWRFILGKVHPSVLTGMSPIKDANGKVVSNSKEIPDIMVTHYFDVADYDPCQMFSKKVDDWDCLELGNRKVELDISRLPEWKEVLLAIRNSKRDTAPGQEFMHVNFLKALVIKECMAKVKTDNPVFKCQDFICIDLSKFDLLTTPMTKFGSSLFNLLKKVWLMGQFPDTWDKVTVVNLPKPGVLDPLDLNIYRGISLMLVMQKVLLSLMAARLEKAAKNSGLISKK